MDINLYKERLEGVLTEMAQIMKEMNLTVTEGNCFKGSSHQYCGSTVLTLEVHTNKWRNYLEEVVNTPFTDEDFNEGYQRITVQHGDGIDQFMLQNGSITESNHMVLSFKDLSN